MRLEDLTVEHLGRGLQIYRELAWPDRGVPRVDTRVIEAAPDLETALEGFERGDPGDDPDSRRYTLRLGNARYPFMKFVLQEHLVAGEFFLSVDTHDNVEVRADAPDHARWEELKRFNRELKDRIEAAWDAAGLPTHHDLLALLAELAREECEDEKRARVLVVDDEVMVSQGLEALLRARGYEVELVHDGPGALVRLAEDPLPDLVLLDFELPGFDGREVLTRMRGNPRTARTPVLMATAANIEVGALPNVSGVLHKPYPRQVLFELIARMLHDESDAGRGPSEQPAP